MVTDRVIARDRVYLCDFDVETRKNADIAQCGWWSSLEMWSGLVTRKKKSGHLAIRGPST